MDFLVVWEVEMYVHNCRDCKQDRYVRKDTLQGTNISHLKGTFESMIFQTCPGGYVRVLEGSVIKIQLIARNTTSI